MCCYNALCDIIPDRDRALDNRETSQPIKANIQNNSHHHMWLRCIRRFIIFRHTPYIKNQHPLYEWLTTKTINGRQNSSVKWNFQKYLVDENGEFLDFYYSITKPFNSRITKHLD